MTGAKLIELRGNRCHCSEELTFSSIRKGTVIVLKWTCSVGHTGEWASSDVTVRRKGQDVYANNLLWCASVLLSGNNYNKVQLMGQFMNLSTPDYSTFSRYMNFNFCSEISQMWKEMKEEVFEVLQNIDGICICGDGRCDSPGHCARYCTYVFMEQILGVILHIEVMDCRETGGVSTVMETQCFRKGIKIVSEYLKVKNIAI